MKKIVIFLISATLFFISTNLSAQTEKNQTDGCYFRFVLESPVGSGWSPSYGINITVDDIDYGIVKLPWGTPSAEVTLRLSSGEVKFFWMGGTSVASIHYFEIYNSSDELIYAAPDLFPVGLLFTYQNECPECIPLTDFEGEYNQETKLVNLNWTAPDSENLMGFNILRNGVLLEFVASTINSYASQTDTLETGEYKYCIVPVYPYICDLEEKCFETYIENLDVKKYSSALSLYPNPANNEIRITNRSHVSGKLSEANYELRIANVEIFDVFGRKQKSRKAEKQNVGSEIVINISHLQAGVYLVKIFTDQGEIVEKIIKQ